MIRVFVYGTLRPGQSHHNRIVSGCKVIVTPAWTYGELYDLGWGFPAMTAGENEVYGDLLEFDDPGILRRIDRLEGFGGKDHVNNFYCRREVQIFIEGQELIAWAYFLSKTQILEHHGKVITSGIW